MDSTGHGDRPGRVEGFRFLHPPTTSTIAHRAEALHLFGTSTIDHPAVRGDFAEGDSAELPWVV